MTSGAIKSCLVAVAVCFCWSRELFAGTEHFVHSGRCTPNALLLCVFLRGAQRRAGVVNILKVGLGFPRQPRWGPCSSLTYPITDLLPDGGGVSNAIAG